MINKQKRRDAYQKLKSSTVNCRTTIPPPSGDLWSVKSPRSPCWNYSPIIQHFPSFTLLLSLLSLFLYYIEISILDLCPIPPTAASRYDYICCCLCNGCYLFLFPFFQEQWKCIPCVTPTPASSQHAQVLVFSLFCLPPGAVPTSLGASCLSQTKRDARAVNSCLGYICTVYLFSHVNIHEAIPNLMEATDKYPLASLRELTTWCSSPCSSSAFVFEG